jgi:hypothetical protein
MYTITKNVIESGNYELSDMLKKLDTLWVQGSITDAEREELMALAREKANVQNSMDVIAKLEELDKRVKALEDAEKNSDTSESEEETETVEPTEPTYPEYTAGKWYYSGDKVSFGGKVYECIAPEGVVCVWSPSEYSAYWEELEQPL